MVDWEKGEPQPSLRERMVQLLHDQPERVWTPAEMRGELFPNVEVDPSDESSDQEHMISLISVAQTNAVVQSTMETLVDENILDKREFRVDQVAEITVNESEYEELIDQWPDDEVYTDRTYYCLERDTN